MNSIKGPTWILTVLVFSVCASDLPVRQDLNVVADANVTVKPPQPFDPQQVFSIPGRHTPLLVGPVAQRPNVVEGLSPAAENSQRSKAAKQKDPVEEELHAGPCRSQEPSVVRLCWSFWLAGFSNVRNKSSSKQFRTQRLRSDRIHRTI